MVIIAELQEPTIFALILKNNVSLAKKLLPYDLKVNVKNAKGQDILEYAKELRANDEMMQFLESYLK